MEDAQIILERHEQRLKTLERDVSGLKAVQTEIRMMNETLVTLATELKHTLAALSKPLYKTNIVLDLLKKPRLNDVAFRYIKQPFFNDVLFSFGQFIFCSL